MAENELIPHLFRTEFSKICSVLVRTFGIENFELAEDIAGETFLAALESWPYNGVPANPVAWLYTVARNKTKNYLIRKQLFSEKIIPAIKPDLNRNLEIDLSEKNISDSLLQMLFAICHPIISADAQIGLALRILCGFGIDEIATAFLMSKQTINKRLQRAKEKLREKKIIVEFPTSSEIDSRLDNVLTTLYLLFSEGYYSEDKEEVIREELCKEAMRLTFLLLENKTTNQPKVNALYALMCFQGSRFPSRKTSAGEIILYDDQDETLWDRELIAKGAWYLNKASSGHQISKYHLEAAIAFQFTSKPDSYEKWENIVQLYDLLLNLEYSPVAALNRIYALSKTKGVQEAIHEAEKLDMKENHFYFALLGELYKSIHPAKAKKHFIKARELAKTEPEKRVLQKKSNNIF